MRFGFASTFFWTCTSCILFLAGVGKMEIGVEAPSLANTMTTGSSSALTCNCSISQSGISYPISSLIGDESAASVYSYGNPTGSSANTGLEIADGLILFLYEDSTTGVFSLFLIADEENSGSGGSMSFELNCLPDTAFISVEDDPGEFGGAPPLITGNWSWASCCTDGGVIENIGCNNTINLDLLISNGIDSILWLTGDIADPEQILLSLNGEAITINCGGGVCCPAGFDTEINITDASCPDTPNGSISLGPQDGTPAYDFSWANGESTADIEDLLPGLYSVTITDAQGCSEILDITVDVSPGIPSATPASISLCSDGVTAQFDLTTAADVVNGGSGDSILWFENDDMTGPIDDPENYLSETTTVYAVVDNGSCLSLPVPISLEVLFAPVADTASLHVCEEDAGYAIFDLTSLDALISGGNGSVQWYFDSLLTNPVANPNSLYTESITVFAVVNDGICLSNVVGIILIVDLSPIGTSAEVHLCGDEFDEAVFDLTLLDQSIGDGVIEWFHDMELSISIFDPTMFSTPSTTVYASIFDGQCYSDAVLVVLIVDDVSDGNPISIEMCDDGFGTALFNLWDYENEVSGGDGYVDWYLDPEATNQISFPGTFLTETTIIYATVNNDICISEPVPIELIVIANPEGNPAMLETCADSTGLGMFDLTATDVIVSGGVGSVEWYIDIQGNIEIGDPTVYLSSGGIVYAQVVTGECVSELVPVDLFIINSVTANPVDYEACEDGTGMALFNLANIENLISGGSGQVSWYMDSLGNIVLTSPDAFYSSDTVVYANVTAGDCVSAIVPVNLTTVPLPSSSGISLGVCGDADGVMIYDLTSLDSLVSDNTGNVMWYGDSLLSASIPDPSDFITGDTIVYAVVSNGVCTSLPAPVVLTVSQGLTAIPAMAEFCVPMGDSLALDLTQLDSNISSGTGQVSWYSDSLGTTVIASTDSFPLTTSTITVFADVTNDTCVSNIVPIQLVALTMPVANTIAIKKCGDASDQVTIDITLFDTIVSSNTGIVTWYADTITFTEIADPTSLVTGDTTVFAIVTNGFCISEFALVTVEVVSNLTVAATNLQVCAVDSDSATIDLITYEFEISGGTGSVVWFYDSTGTDTISDPTNFTTSGDTVFVKVYEDNCSSEIAQIIIEFESSSFPVLECAYTSIDSIAVTWLANAINYELSYAINGQMIGPPGISQTTEFSLGSLAQGDTVTLWVVALFDSICTEPLESFITCITDNCPPQTLNFSGLDSSYCRDISFIPLKASPPGGQFSGQGVSGDTLFPKQVTGSGTVILYTLTDSATSCIYNITAGVGVFDPLNSPLATCLAPTLNSVSFGWSDAGAGFGYVYTVNQGPISGTVLTDDSTLVIDGLNEGDGVTLYLWSVGSVPCGNSDTISVSCVSKACPDAELIINDPGPICSENAPFQLDVMITGLGNPTIIWSGEGIADPSGIFDPVLASLGEVTLTVTAEEDGCKYTTEIDVRILEQPEAAFEVSGTPCLDSSLHIVYTGNGAYASWLEWDLDGADPIAGLYPKEFDVQWQEPGSYTLSLLIDVIGCRPDSFLLPVSISAPLDTPRINCVNQDFHTVIIEWEPVVGASAYTATANIGSGVVAGNTFTVSNLPDDALVNIEVTAQGASACGPTSATIQCHTLPIVPPAVYIANVFSPNGDGVNDVFYIQTNEEISDVLALRIFDRWGNVVFEKSHFPPNDLQFGWEGTFSGEELNSGVFVYATELLTVDGETVLMKGNVTLIR